MSNASDPIDAKLDGWLADWPAPERNDGAWENFGSKLDERLAGLEIGQGEEAWLEAPLPTEPGEGNSDNAVFEAGGASMSEPESDKPESDKPKKKSLKDFAQRVSVTPPTPSEAKPTASPLPKAGETPLPVSGPRGSSPSLRASASFVSRPPEARDSDSGILDLNAVRKSAASIPDAGAQPGENGLFDDEAKVAVPVKAPPKKSSAIPIIGGGLVAVLALAAAAILVVRSSGQSDMSAAEAPMVAAAPPPADQAEPAAEKARAAASGLTAEGLALATASAPAEEPAAPGRAESETDDEAKTAAAKTDDKKEKSDEKADKQPTDPKDLAGAMATAVGENGTSKDDDGKKAAGPGVDPGSIPDSPSQGAIQGAIGSVKGAAKGCVAGMDEPSRATITFASNGTVSSVSVSGGAAGKPAAGCIQSALKRARVGPFKRSSFTVGVTLRP